MIWSPRPPAAVWNRWVIGLILAALALAVIVGISQA